MAKIPYPRIEDTPQKIQSFFNKIKANTPRILNVNLMMAHSPGSVRELIRLGNRLLFRAELNPRFRELAILRQHRDSPLDQPFDRRSQPPSTSGCQCLRFWRHQLPRRVGRIHRELPPIPGNPSTLAQRTVPLVGPLAPGVGRRP